MNWMLLPFKRYAEASGRSQRKEYWMFFLFTMLAGGVIDVVFSQSSEVVTANSFWWQSNLTPTGDIVNGLFGLGTLIPSLTVGIRRLHDTDRSGWNLLWWLLPIIGWIVILIYLCQDGTRGRNSYGPDPKGADLDDVFS